MLKPLLAAMALALALATSALAQTQRVQLTDQSWVDLGATPLTVRTLGPTPAFIIIDTTPPVSLTAGSTVLGNEAQTGLSVTVTGQHVYARASYGQTAVATLPNASSGGGGGGGATGSVTSAGTNGTQAQAIQGIQGGVPLNGFTGQYNSTLPTFTNAQVGYLSVDSNGRQILSPSSSVSVSASALPTGAATAANQITMVANQNSTPAGTSATNAQGVQGVTGGVPLGIVAQDGLIPTGSPFSTSAATTLFSLDTTGYQSTIVQLSGTWSGVVSYEVSNDNTNWVAVVGQQPASPSGGPFTTDSGPGIRVFPVTARYFRARVSTYNSGTIVAAVIFRSSPISLPQSGVAITNNPIIGAGASSIGGLTAVSSANGIASFSRLPSSAASTNLTQAKATAGRLYKLVACNTTTTPARIKFYNATSANVTVGTTTPLLTRPIPAAATAGGLACVPYDWSDIGAYFSTAISWAITTGAADTDATAVAAGAITDVSVEYQ